jgi:hypothetical protein
MLAPAVALSHSAESYTFQLHAGAALRIYVKKHFFVRPRIAAMTGEGSRSPGPP